MNYSIFMALIALSMTLPAYAQDKKDASVNVTKTQITCSYNSEYAFKSEGETKFSATELDKSRHFVSTRTTRHENGVEYRTTEYQSFDEKGALQSVGNASLKIVTEKVGNKLIESADIVTANRLVSDATYENGKKTKEKTFSTRTVYQVNGNERILLEYEMDGQAKPTRGTRIVTTYDGDRRIENSTSNPYSEKHDKFDVKIFKDQSTCIYENLK